METVIYDLEQMLKALRDCCELFGYLECSVLDFNVSHPSEEKVEALNCDLENVSWEYFGVIEKLKKHLKALAPESEVLKEF